MQTLLDFLDRYVRGQAEALVYDDGVRTRSHSGRAVSSSAAAFADRLRAAGVAPGDAVMIWAESRPEWVVAFWGCLIAGVAAVPVEMQSSPELVARIVAIARPKGVIAGAAMPVSALPDTLWVWPLESIEWVETAPETRAPVTAESIAEIVFTSGTTGEPRGVLITHRNLVANIRPIERLIEPYRRYLRWAGRIRLLNLLPLTHMFGQALSMFFPPIVNGATYFTTSHNPDQIISDIRRHRITLVVTVPRVLAMLRDRVIKLASSASDAREEPITRRLWRHRDVRRLFGWRCVGFVLGGAPLDQALEDEWRRLGYAVIQGYGLTETAPMVTFNHPLSPKHGTVGKPIEGVEVKIGDDGEILVKGDIVTAGYLSAPGQRSAAVDDGWFHTGDIGAFDDTGRLVIRGRKKDLIATPEGLKVFPQDIERVLEAQPGVKEAAVVGHVVNHAEEVHAVLVLAPGADPAAIVAAANRQLESHQRIRDFSVWTTGELPRTGSLRKLKRGDVREWVRSGVVAKPSAAPPGGDLAALLSRYTKGRPAAGDASLDELGLTSLDRIELMTALEDRAQVELSEAAVSEARTVTDLQRLVEKAPESGPVVPVSFPAWSRRWLPSAVRAMTLRVFVLPLSSYYARVGVEGVEHLSALTGPVIFAANHQSHFDTPVILKALPARFRRSLAVAMWKEFFDEGATRRVLYYLAALVFNGFPLAQREGATRQTLRYIGGLVDAGQSILIFPEGKRTEAGEINRFRPGIGMLGARLHIPVVPVRLVGVDRVLHRSWKRPRRGEVTVRFGAPMTLESAEYAALAGRVEAAVRALDWGKNGAGNQT
ncbi:MAG: hypothetical protein EPO35_03235 [Acidobacteria bacterium]|nr:MAG: hypothetical protein EPO35_03235 [Acidobacteriota bacterium]